MTATVLIVCVLILLNALYVAAEFAILGSRVNLVQRHVAQGNRVAAALLPIVSSTGGMDRYIAACQVGITVTSLVLGAFGQATISVALAGYLLELTDIEHLTAYTIAAVTVLTLLTSMQVVFGELIPKTVALQYPVRTAMYTYHPMRWSLALFTPLIAILNGSGNFVLRRLGAHAVRGHRHVHSPDEIELLVRESRAGGLMDERQRIRLQRTLRLSRRPVRQIMSPRRQIASINLDEPVETLLTSLIASPFTRLIAHRGDLGSVEGYLHSRDVAAALAGRQTPTDLTPLVRPITKLSWRLTVDQVLGELREHHARIALVVDDFGELEGLVSLEDILRELVGGVTDEFKADLSFREPTRLAPGKWRLPGRLPLDELTEWALGLGIEPAWTNTDAETLAGWLIVRAATLPSEGQRIEVDDLLFTVEGLNGMAIDSAIVEFRPVQRREPDDA